MLNSGRALIQQSLTLSPVFINSFMYGAATSWASNALTFFTDNKSEINASVEECGLMAQTFEAGRLIFSIPSGILADITGRKTLLILVGVINFVSWIVLSMSTSLTVIFIARFALGVAVSLLYVSAYTMIGETASPNYRGTLTSVNEAANMFGQLYESLITIVANSYKVMNTSTVIATSFFFPSIYYLVESPYYLTNAAKFQTAKNVLKTLRPGYTDGEIDDEFDALVDSVRSSKNRNRTSDVGDVNWLTIWKIKSLRRPLECAVLLNIFAVTCGGPAITLYITVILPANPYFSNSFYPFFVFFMQFIGSLGSTLIIDRFPRRILFLATMFVSAAMQMINAIACWAYWTTRADFWKWVYIGNIMAYMLIDRGLISPLNCTVRSEIFPHRTKGIGNALCSICQSMALIVVYQMFETIHTTRYGDVLNFIVFVVNSLILAGIVYKRLPETSNKTLVQVQNEIEIETSERMSIKKNSKITRNYESSRNT